MIATITHFPDFSARGAHVRVSEESILIRRSPLGATVYGGDVELPTAGLVGWNLAAPDDLSPGRIELLIADVAASAATEKRTTGKRTTGNEPEEKGTVSDGRGRRHISRYIVNYSPGQQPEFDALAHQLMLLQAGYDLQTGKPGQATETSVEKTTEKAPFQEASGHAGGSGAARPGNSRGGGDKGRSAAWQKVATPEEIPETNTEADIDDPLYGQVVCVTGDVSPYDKGDIWNLIAAHGAKVSKSVTKKTSMLILGQWESMTAKEKRARELRDKGQDISLISLDEFLVLAGEK